jgi:ferredoxin
VVQSVSQALPAQSEPQSGSFVVQNVRRPSLNNLNHFVLGSFYLFTKAPLPGDLPLRVDCNYDLEPELPEAEPTSQNLEPVILTVPSLTIGFTCAFFLGTGSHAACLDLRHTIRPSRGTAANKCPPCHLCGGCAAVCPKKIGDFLKLLPRCVLKLF